MLNTFTILAFAFTLLLAAHNNPKGFSLASSLFGFLVMAAFAILLLIPGMGLAFWHKTLNGELLMGYYGVAIFTSLSMVAACFAFYFWQDYQKE